jgi:hypothetical protein
MNPPIETKKPTKSIATKNKQEKPISPAQTQEAILAYGIAAKFSKTGFGPIVRADVLQAVLTKRLHVDQTKGYRIILDVGASPAERLKISISLTPGAIDVILRATKNNPGSLTTELNHVCSYLNREGVKKRFMAFKGKRRIELTLKGNSILPG